MGCMTKLIKLIGFSVAFFFGILLAPNLLPENVKFTPLEVAPVKDFGKGLTPNEVLHKAEKLFENELKGPECFEIVNNELYTTLHGGYVAKVYDDQIIPVVKFGKKCSGWWEEHICGRPLGIKAYDKEHLVIADAYNGIFKYNIKTAKYINIVDKDAKIDGVNPKIFNSVEVGKDGSIYWTHSSSDFGIDNGIYTLLADGSGRLLKYDPETKENVVLMKGLYFANGIALSPNEDFLIVSETGHSRVHKFHLEGPKKFTSEIFMDGLPGMPDNLRSNNKGGFFVPLVLFRDEHNPTLIEIIGPFPMLRKFLFKFLYAIELTLQKINEIYPNYYLKRAIHFCGHFESVEPILPQKTIIMDVDINGNVIKSYHSSNGHISSISDVVIHNGYMYLGSPSNNYLARVKLSHLEEPSSVKAQIPKVTEPKTKPRTTTAPPRTTTTTTTTTPPRTTTKPTTTPPPRTTTKSTTAPPPRTTGRPTTTPPPRTTSPLRATPKPTTTPPSTASKPSGSLNKPSP